MCSIFDAERRRKLHARKGKTMAEPLEDAVESDYKKVALWIAILALFLALAEAGAKNAEHRATELNIESSHLYNFYQAKKVRSSIAETAAESLEARTRRGERPAGPSGDRKQIASWKATVARFEKDPKTPEDSLDAIQEAPNRPAKGASSTTASSNTTNSERGAADRRGARLRRNHHRRGGASLDRRRPWPDRRGVLGLGHLAPTLLPFFG